ncbi:MAG: hypothetical protein ACPL7K_08065 [Armatimonadota bacterium]
MSGPLFGPPVFRAGFLGVILGVGGLLPVAAVVGDFRVEIVRLVVAAVACLAGGVLAAVWAEAGGHAGPQGLVVLLGGTLRVVVPLALLALGAICAGWLVSVSTLLYSVVIYTLIVGLQTWVVASRLTEKPRVKEQAER